MLKEHQNTGKKREKRMRNKREKKFHFSLFFKTLTAFMIAVNRNEDNVFKLPECKFDVLSFARNTKKKDTAHLMMYSV